MIKKDKYWTGAHTKHRMLYHIVWIAKYRKRVLEGKLSKRLKDIFIIFYKGNLKYENILTMQNTIIIFDSMQD